MVLLLFSAFTIDWARVVSNEEFSCASLSCKLGSFSLLIIKFSLLIVKLTFGISDLWIKIWKVSIDVVNFAFECFYLIWKVINIDGGIVNMIYFITKSFIIFFQSLYYFFCLLQFISQIFNLFFHLR